MAIRFEDITDQQCADIIAHFAKRKMVDNINEIVIHVPEGEDIIISKKKKRTDVFDDGSAACAAACCAMIAATI